MGHTYTALHYHIVFGTKGRAPSIRADRQARLYEYIGGIIRGQGGACIEIGGTADHIHLLATVPTTIALSDLLRRIKANSSKWLHETAEGMGDFAWQAGYGAFTVSQSNLADVATYIRNQQQHHAKQSFEDELVAFLRRHDIAYDERYVLG